MNRSGLSRRGTRSRLPPRLLDASVVVGLFGCDLEYGLAGSGDKRSAGEDTAEDEPGVPTPPDDDPGGRDGCWPILHGETIVNIPDYSPVDGSLPGTFCALSTGTLAEGFEFDFSYHSISSATVAGYQISAAPERFVSRLVGINRAVNGGHYPDFGNNYSSLLAVDSVPTKSGASWTITADTSAELADFAGGECYPECDWNQVTLEIYDEATAVSGTCLEMYGIDMDFCPEFASASAARLAGAERCQPGIGRFQLLPVAMFDRNGDGRAGMVLQPVQLEGTGRLTAAAWFDSVLVSGDRGYDLTILEAGFSHPYFDSSDQILPTAGRALSPGRSRQSLVPGVVGGDAPFLLEHVSVSETPNLQFEAAWSCGAETESGTDAGGVGFSFALAEFDCVAKLPQRLTVRPGPPGTGMPLGLELAGLPDGRFQVPTTPSVRGDEFTIERRGLIVTGVLSGSTSNRWLSVDSVTYAGVPVCGASSVSLR